MSGLSDKHVLTNFLLQIKRKTTGRLNLGRRSPDDHKLILSAPYWPETPTTQQDKARNKDKVNVDNIKR